MPVFSNKMLRLSELLVILAVLNLCFQGYHEFTALKLNPIDSIIRMSSSWIVLGVGLLLRHIARYRG